MFRKKLFFILLPLVFYVNAVEIYNNGQSTETPWYKDWRKPLREPTPVSNNEVTISNASTNNQEASSTSLPKLAIKKTNSYIVRPWGTSEIGPNSSSATIEAFINTPTSTVSPPVTANPEEPVVEIKPRHRSFNFGPTEASQSETGTKWIPVSSLTTSQSSKPFSSATVFDKAQEEPRLESKRLYHSFNFGPNELSQSELQTTLPPVSSTWSTEKLEPIPSSTIPTTINEEKPRLEHQRQGIDFTPTEGLQSESLTTWVPSSSTLVPSENLDFKLHSNPTIVKVDESQNELESKSAKNNLASTEVGLESQTPRAFISVTSIEDESKPFSTTPVIATTEEPNTELKARKEFKFGPIDSHSESDPKWTPRSLAWPPSESLESKTPESLKLKEPGLKPKPRHHFFNLESTKPTEASWKTQPITDSNPRTTEFIAVSESPSASKKYLLKPKPTSSFLVAEPGYNATELGLSAELATLEKSPGVILYQYEETEGNPLSTRGSNKNFFTSSFSQQEYKCQVKNGFYEVVSNCDKFVECKNNVLKLYRCFNGLHFNRNAVWPSDPCDEPSKAKCQINEIEVKPKPAPKFSATLISSHIDYIMCPSNNGYYRLQNDARSFISNGAPSSYQCLPGLKFNSYASWGQDPCSGDIQCRTVIVRPEPEFKFSASLIEKLPSHICPRSEGYFGSEDDCEEFIKCEKSIASLYKCAPGLQFNRFASWIQNPCASESVIRCKTVIVHPPPEPKMSAVLITRLSDYYCPATNRYYKFENDCEKFIKCENSIASSYKCNPGLQFNTYAQWGTDPCATSEIVRCKTVIIHPKLDPTLSAVIIVKQFNFSCPTSEGYYGTDSDCDQFYRCEKSIASLYRCSEGLQFNRYAILGQDPCASASEVRCQTIVIEPQPEHKFSAELIARDIGDYECASSEGYFKLGTECDKFIKCEKSKAASYKCWPGLQFDIAAAWGDDPCASVTIIGCKAVIPEPKPNFSATIISRVVLDFTCPSNKGYFDSKNDCEQFIKCENAVASLYKCLPGMQFNRYSTWGEDPCAIEAVVRCQPVIIPQPPPPKPEFSADNIIRHLWEYECEKSDAYYKLGDDCEKFIKCENSVPSSYKCWSGLEFNPQAAYGQNPCASESIIGCKADSIEPKPTVPPAKISAILISTIFDFVCPKNNGYFDSKNECEKFIKCENAVASLYKCLPGLQFNRNSAWGEDPCASEAVVRCQPVVIPPTPPPKPKISADMILRHMWGFDCEKNDGYFKLGDECDKFIKCEDAMASSYRCWTGLQFNPQAKFGEDPCAIESIIGCKAASIEPKSTVAPPKFSAIPISNVFDYVCPKNNGYFDSKNECEKFIKCENAVASLYKCLPGLQFNRNSVWGEDPCASEAVVRCQPVVIPPPPPPKPKFSADLLVRRMWEYECETSNGYFKLGDECGKFIKCENSVASSYKCWSGLQFNSKASWGQDPCASETIVGCKAAAVEPKPTIPPPKFSDVIISRNVFDFLCPAKNGYFESKNECKKFIKCENAIASLYKCLPGLQFNRNSVWGEDPCASESIVGCKSITIPPTREPVFSGILISKELEDYRCTEANGYYGIDNNCERFVQCKMFVPSLYMCPNGLQFNPRARYGEDPCALQSIVMCRTRPPTTTSTTTTTPVLSYILITRQVFGYTCSAANGYYSVKGECGQFIECKNYLPSLYRCNSGLYFNRNAMWGAEPCALPSIARCDNNSFKKPPGPIDHNDDFECPAQDGPYQLDTMECSQFMMCQKGKGTIMPCPSGLVFNPELQACDWPVNVPSCNPDVFRGFSCPAPGADKERIIKFKYEDSCSKYVACQQGRPRLLSCDKGLSFSEEDQTCISSERVPHCRR